jgi:hypothetical protein
MDRHWEHALLFLITSPAFVEEAPLESVIGSHHGITSLSMRVRENIFRRIDKTARAICNAKHRPRQSVKLDTDFSQATVINPIEVLRYGVTGLGLLLAYLAFRLLRIEQARVDARDDMLKSSTRFMVFSFLLCALGLLSQFVIPGCAALDRIDETLATLSENEHAELSVLVNRADKIRADAAKISGLHQDTYVALISEASALDARANEREQTIVEKLSAMTNAISSAKSVCKPSLSEP